MEQDHILKVHISKDEEYLRYRIKMIANVPILKTTDYAHPEWGSSTVYVKEYEEMVSRKRCKRRYKKLLRSAQKRYNALMEFRECKVSYEPKVNLEYKL